jgi:putative spermidine/putrescine transport system ATP-binding protein
MSSQAVPIAGARGAGARIQFEGVTKRYGQLAALDGIDLTIEAGEFFTLLGPSGSGKSTLLALIAGFDQLTSGSILVDGVRADDVPPHRRGFGVVFQNYALFPHLTVEENVAYSLRARRLASAEIRDRVAGALHQVRLDGLSRRYPRQLSGGQQQRVAMARAIVFRPRVLLMDEPLGALDRKLRVDLQVELKQLHRELGSTIVFVSHDQEEALALSDRIAVLRSGRIEQVDTPGGLYRRPATPFVAGFVGDSNFFDGTLHRSGNAAWVELAQGLRVPLGSSARPDGDPITLSVRPEQVALTMESGDGLAGPIIEIIYVGTTTKILIETQCGRAQAWLPAQEVQSHVLGQRVTLRWAPDAATLHARNPGPR